MKCEICGKKEAQFNVCTKGKGKGKYLQMFKDDDKPR